MSDDEQSREEMLGIGMAIVGVVVVVVLVAAFLWGETHDVDTTPLLAILSPVVGALFLTKPLQSIRNDTKVTKANTNGHLTAVTQRNRELAEENRELREQFAAVTGSPSMEG